VDGSDVVEPELSYERIDRDELLAGGVHQHPLHVAVTNGGHQPWQSTPGAQVQPAPSAGQCVRHRPAFQYVAIIKGVVVTGGHEVMRAAAQ